MVRRLVISVLVLLCSLPPAIAGGKEGRQGSVRFKYGVEWGYNATFLDKYHYDYIEAVDGFRVDERDTRLFLYSNGNVLAKAGLEFGDHCSAFILAGYEGIRQDTRIFPVTLRGTYHLAPLSSDGVMTFIEGGAGFHPDFGMRCVIGKAGAGYRIKLSRKGSLDMLAAIQICGDHPPIYDREISGKVPAELVRTSDSMYGALVMSMSISF